MSSTCTVQPGAIHSASTRSSVLVFRMTLSKMIHVCYIQRWLQSTTFDPSCNIMHCNNVMHVWHALYKAHQRLFAGMNGKALRNRDRPLTLNASRPIKCGEKLNVSPQSAATCGRDPNMQPVTVKSSTVTADATALCKCKPYLRAAEEQEAEQVLRGLTAPAADPAPPADKRERARAHPRFSFPPLARTYITYR